MKALVKKQAGPGLQLVEMPEPEIGHNDVLIKIKKISICGTDLKIYQWNDWAKQHIKPPLIIGHEFCGVIAEVGQEVSGFKAGDRVSAECHVTCGDCRNCRAGLRHLCPNTHGIGIHKHGGFADFVVVPSSNVFKLPDGLDDDIGAILDPLGNAVHCALSFNLVAEDVLITGAGPIGIMACAIATHCGARHIVITDVNDYRLELAKNMGATHTLNVEKQTLSEMMHDLHMVSGFDVGLEMSGNGLALQAMLEHMYHGGKIALLGLLPDKLAIDWEQIIFHGLTLKGIYGREMYESWYKMISLIEAGLQLKPIITHHFKAENYEKAFTIACSGQAGKIIIEWN